MLNINKRKMEIKSKLRYVNTNNKIEIKISTLAILWYMKRQIVLLLCSRYLYKLYMTSSEK